MEDRFSSENYIPTKLDNTSKYGEAIELLRKSLRQMEDQYHTAENLEMLSMETMNKWKRDIKIIIQTIDKLQK